MNLKKIKDNQTKASLNCKKVAIVKDNQVKNGLRRKNSTRVKDAQQYNYQPKTHGEFHSLVHDLIRKRGYNADLNDIDTSLVTDMSYLFDKSWFNGDISGWDVSNVTRMTAMFDECLFDGDISGWDVSNVTNMDFMFKGAKFTGDISGWDVSKVESAYKMFTDSMLSIDNIPEALKDVFLENQKQEEPKEWPKNLKVKGSKTAGVAVMPGNDYDFEFYFGKKNDFANNQYYKDLFEEDGSFEGGNVHTAIVWGVKNNELVSTDIEDFKDLGTYVLYTYQGRHEPVIVQSNDVKELVSWILKDNEQGLDILSELHYDGDEEGFGLVSPEINGKDVSYEELVEYLKSLL